MADEPRLAVESIAGLRPYQEDSVLTETLSDGRILIAVADGMGGHAAGEVASALALESLVAALEDGLDLDTAFTHANEQVHRKAEEPGKQGMGTTLVAALVEDGEYFIANVGDSRGYLVAGDGIRQLTEDHSFVAEAVKRGQSLEEAMATPWRDALTVGRWRSSRKRWTWSHRRPTRFCDSLRLSAQWDEPSKGGARWHRSGGCGVA